MTDLELYKSAKEAYYNGEPIMTDYEFDELEEKLGLSNKSYVGTKHNPTYTIKHPFIMGSLSKVQIKEKDGVIDWDSYWEDVKTYIYRNNPKAFIITPKFDGCSFEAHFDKRDGSLNISSRGDGEYGKDLTSHLIRKFNQTHYNLPYQNYILRGEVLIEKSVFEKKYSEFVNPRSFVSGILNREYSEDMDFQEMLDDLSIVIYDVRVKTFENWVDYDWCNFEFDYCPEYAFYPHILKTVEDFKEIYDKFDYYRSKCEYALDGIVIKPAEKYRINNITETRPKDCVAIKFIPMLQETEVVDIEWSLAKNGELRPVVIVNPVYMDGKKITRASAHNYGYMCDNCISIGTKLILSLAGDIIPFVYKVTDTSHYDYSKMNIPENSYVDICHLYKEMTNEEIREQKFIESVNTLSIPSIGPAAAQKIYNYLLEDSKGDEFLGIPSYEVPNNILLIKSNSIINALGGKTGEKALREFNKFLSSITLEDIIVSCTFESCGRAVATQIVKEWLYKDGDFSHLASKAYEWALDMDSDNYKQVMKIMLNMGKTFESFKINEIKDFIDERTPIIMTGEPNDYDTKGAFLKAHPEYRETTSWKEVKIVFTNSLDSNTGKMKKAREKGIELRLY